MKNPTKCETCKWFVLNYFEEAVNGRSLIYGHCYCLPPTTVVTDGNIIDWIRVIDKGNNSCMFYCAKDTESLLENYKQVIFNQVVVDDDEEDIMKDI